jgi:hypothetical protein
MVDPLQASSKRDEKEERRDGGFEERECDGNK